MKKPILTALLTFVLIITAATSTYGALFYQTDATFNANQSVTYITFNTTVPPLPSGCCKYGVEQHVVINNSISQFETAVGLGCIISLNKACSTLGYKNWYIVYDTLVNKSSGLRTHYPANGIRATPGSTYTFALWYKVTPCTGETLPAMLLTIKNTTFTYQTKVCGSNSLLQGRTFTFVQAGLLELHNLTACSQLPSPSYTQTSILIVDNGVVITPIWTSHIFTTSFPNCNWGLSYANSGSTVTIDWTT